MREARLKNKLEIVIPITEPPRNVCTDEFPDNEFDRRFIQNEFGVSCAVRFWSEKATNHVPQKTVNLVRQKVSRRRFSHNTSVRNT
jgi:hypothetical protein